jgi:hypothetical protein
MSTHKYVGLDVHKDTVMIAIADGRREGEVRLYGEVSNDLEAIDRVLRKLRADGSTLHVAYEAGPTGFVLYRRMRQWNLDCIVVAPSKTPQEKGGRQKNDQRDALQLARLHRAGELVGIHVPEEADEAIRDLTRARADAVDDLRRAKQRLNVGPRGHGVMIDNAVLNSRVVVKPLSRNRRTYWLTLAGLPMARRSASHAFEAEVAAFIRAASFTFSDDEYLGPSFSSRTCKAFATRRRLVSQSSDRSC